MEYMSRRPSRRGAPRVAAVLAALSLVVAAFAASGQATTSAPGKKYTLGVSNTLVGNGWREGMICSIKAQALQSGQVKSLRIAHRLDQRRAPLRMKLTEESRDPRHVWRRHRRPGKLGRLVTRSDRRRRDVESRRRHVRLEVRG